MAKRVYTPKDIESKKYECFDWDGEWLSAFGNPAMNSRWFVLGPSASGKSSFVMQLAKKLCEYGPTLYMSYEEGVGMEFQRRLKLMKMNEVQGRFVVTPDDTYKEIMDRLSKPKSPRFIVVDSFQVSDWSYEQALELMKRYPQKGFVFISQEDKGQPIGKAAVRLRYIADMKIRVAGYKAYCQGRSAGSPGNYYVVWKEGVLMTSNNL
jgi:hypothetical protein